MKPTPQHFMIWLTRHNPWLLALLLMALGPAAVMPASAQEQYGNTLNLGLGIGGYAGYYSYAGRTLPVFHLDYEIDIARNLTFAPFVSLHSYTRDHYWGNPNKPHQYYRYRQIAVPIGLKGFYYFDSFLKANEKWDIYLAGSLGFVLVSHRWDAGYGGDRDIYRAPLLLFDLHIGAEYHINQRLGIFLDLSSGVSTIGLAIHTKN
jgi:hypothetical protein